MVVRFKKEGNVLHFSCWLPALPAVRQPRSVGAKSVKQCGSFATSPTSLPPAFSPFVSTYAERPDESVRALACKVKSSELGEDCCEEKYKENRALIPVMALAHALVLARVLACIPNDVLGLVWSGPIGGCVK